jgi:hypothetical protein
MKKLKIVFLFLFLLLITIAIFLKISPPSSNNPLSSFPKCPSNLVGILKYPLIDIKSITAIWPLGNIAPPGHTSPVDHNYFDASTDDKVAVYAPADGWITEITAILSKDEKTGKYVDKGITINIEICKGLVLTFANLTESASILKDNWPKNDNGCRYDINKTGHDYTEGQCYFHSNIKVKAGDLLGYTQNETKKDGSKGFAFEIWAADYNKTPRTDVNWKYYDDNRYAHIMCTFDLYSGDLKNQFSKKFGFVDPKTHKFKPRTIEPLCGQVNQDIVGTVQGMWFSKATPKDDYDTKFDGGLAFIHNNMDPKTGEISIGGDLNNGKADTVFFNPTISGQISREPSEIKADGKIYCYDATRDSGIKRFLVQLVDSHHLTAEIQNGTCDGNYFFIKSFNYER